MSDVKLRSILESDLETIRNWRNSKEVSQYMYTDNIISPEQQIQWFKKISNDNSSRYWIIEYDNQAVGVVSISEISDLYDSCFWGFYIGNTNFRGLGIASKVEYLILSYVFDTLKLNKLRCEAFSDNKVINLHEKFGFRREAYYRNHIKKGEKYFDVVGLAILKKEWDILKNNYQQ
ncbi:MAG: UDP-4-amino-4,6-dideoxy-N-acetyl-beta-L-altrosamine N-acetyltransferase [Endomicrobium sp.]|jgi:UDP-4-amino-4,6-dideoxy-N-acetyl-beta-L-altrosamine N-acetyltransferase|nr:UDP-4-amino-4,6-dideoxy-N-acetyl-beta-L-altrosamine N-acetyltransferase [Endomicrobium sp.]